MAAPIMSSKFTNICRSCYHRSFRNAHHHQFQIMRLLARHYSECSNVRVRFAPSPTGFLHLGGLRTALYNFLYSRSVRDGRFILRIEDTDQSRAVPGAIGKLQEALKWAGIKPDEGPDVGGKHGPYIQSQRLNIYQEHIQTLLSNGWAYPCFCTARRLELMRKEAARKQEPSKYDGRCRTLSEDQVKKLKSQGIPHVVRLKMEPTPDPWDDIVKGEISHNVVDSEGDPVLMKSDGFPTYHFANVVDDHLMEVTHVLRGSEWLASTPKHILLYKAFGWKPPMFGHLPLIVNQDGTKLSKRQDDIHVKQFMEMGYFPQAVLNYITSIGGGFSRNTLDMSLEEMCSSFEVAKIKNHPAQLNPLWLNDSNRNLLRKQVNSGEPVVLTELAEQLRQLVISTFNERLGEGSLREQVLSDSNLLNIVRWSLQDDRTSILADFVKPELEYLWVTPSQSNLSELVNIENNAEALLSVFLEWVNSAELNFSVDHLGKELRTFALNHNLKANKFFKIMRLALTGLQDGPPVAEMMSIFGRDNVIMRLKSSLNSLRHS